MVFSRCFFCSTALNKRHTPIDFAARWSYLFQIEMWYPEEARLCPDCFGRIDADFFIWQLLGGPSQITLMSLEIDEMHQDGKLI
ncbi:MAG TPA: hypothetical protein VGL94_18085 [Ktedonobacteraceae bacterium]